MKSGDDFPAFKNKFVRLAGELDVRTKDWKNEFERRLPPSITNGLTAQYLDRKVNFESYATMAQKVATKLKRSYAKRDKEKEKDDKKKTPASSALSAPRPTTTASASRPPATNNKTAVTSTGKKVNLRRPDESRLETLVREGRCFICEEQDHTSRDCPHKGEVEQLRKAHVQNIVAQFTRSDDYWDPPAPASQTGSATAAQLLNASSDSEN